MSFAILHEVPGWAKINRKGSLICNLRESAIIDIVGSLSIENVCITKEMVISSIYSQLDKIIDNEVRVLERLATPETTIKEVIVSYFGIPMLGNQSDDFIEYRTVIKELFIMMFTNKLITIERVGGYILFNRIWFGTLEFSNITPKRPSPHARIKKVMHLEKCLASNVVPKMYEIIDRLVNYSYTPIATRAVKPKGLVIQWEELLK